VRRETKDVGGKLMKQVIGMTCFMISFPAYY